MFWKGTYLTKDNSEQEESEQGKIWKRTNLKRKHLTKDNSGKEKSEKGQLWKGTI